MDAAVRRFRQDVAVHLGHGTGAATRFTPALRREDVVMLRGDPPSVPRQAEPIQAIGSKRL